jgi:hypothetical protein
MTRVVAYEDDRFWTAVRKDPMFPRHLEPFLTGDVGEILMSDQDALSIMAWARTRPEWNRKTPPLVLEPLARAL